MLFHQSDLSAYSRCAAAYGYKRQGLPTETNSAAAYGSVMHHALQVFEIQLHEARVLKLKGSALREAFLEAQQRALETFIHYWNPTHIEAICDPVPANGWLPRQGYSELRARGIDTIREYAEMIRTQDDELLATEYGFIVPIDGTWDDDLGEPHMLAGSVDRLAVRRYKGDPAVNIDDWKTGKEYRFLRQNLQFTAYCASPETPILMADLTWRPLRCVAVGDEIMAVDEYPEKTSGGANRRHWRTTTVEDVWEVRKQAYRLVLSDGTTLVCGEGHRYLAQREGGWEWRTVEDLLRNLNNPRRKNFGIKIARAFEPASFFNLDHASDDYKAGYIAGATLGDGCIRVDDGQPFWQIGVGESDKALLDRLFSYLAHFDISVNWWSREPDGRGWQRNKLIGLRSGVRQTCEQVQAMMENPADSDEYVAGWLAGLYDTDGGLGSSGTVNFYQNATVVLERVGEAADQLGFDFKISPTGKSTALVGDRTERAAFLALIRPALTRKVEELDATTLRIFDDVRVVEIEPLGEMDLIDITTGTATYIADGVISHNCYASTKLEFWTGFRGAEGYGPDRGAEMHHRFELLPRRGTWINLKRFARQDAGWRTETDYKRFALAVEQLAAAIKADIFPLSISGENCHYCDFKLVCGGLGTITDGSGQ